MAQPAYRTLPDPDERGFDLSSIFIAREQQLDLFDIYLARWKKLILAAKSEEDTPLIAPSPNSRLQGLLVLLYGRGGFGKSTLLKHYVRRASEGQQHLTISAIVDWEHAIEGKRTLFNPAPDQEVDAFEYYRVLCTQLAAALSKPLKDFKNYHTAVKNFEDARKQAGTVLDRMQSDDRYADLRGLTVDMLSTLIGTLAPAPFSKLATSDKTKEIANEGIKVGVEMIARLHMKLCDALGNKLGDYLDAYLHLGAALGRDLRDFAKNFSLLIFFDTYEEVDTADRLLRIVMGAAGLRVGWILAGRDNLWGGSEQRKRSIAKEYGYKDIIPADRGLQIDFNVGGVGAFTLSDIQQYFDQLCHSACYEPPLPSLTEDQIERILDVTQGIPLAVSIAAALYLDTGNAEQITEELDGKRQIVEQMVERYLLHARDEQSERLKLYGLALLRRADRPPSVAGALGLSEEDARTNYQQELSRLHRRYSFIFTEKGQPSLHQEVRHFLRLWLLEHRRDPEIIVLNIHLKEVHEAEIKHLEERRYYKTLQERLQDDEWIGIYLDFVEQQFWLDPADGLQALLPFMIAASIYRRGFSKDATELGTFFADQLGSPYHHWWMWAFQGLSGAVDSRTDDQKLLQSVFGITDDGDGNQQLAGLQNLVQLMEQHSLILLPFLSTIRPELEATLWWRLAEALRVKDRVQAFRWYEKALTRLSTQDALKETAAHNALNVTYELYNEKKYDESLPFLNRVIDLKPDDAYAYSARGTVYQEQEEYQLAIQDYNRAIELDPNNTLTYNNRGTAYQEQEEYQLAIQDYNRAIELDLNFILAYSNRGSAYYEQEEYQQAIQDYTRAIELAPNDASAYNGRGTIYGILKEYQLAIQDYTWAIKLTPNDAVAYHNRGLTYRDLKEYQQAIHDFDRAIELAPNNATAYEGRGSTNLYLRNAEQAKADYNDCYRCDHTNNNAAWMAEWVAMGKSRIGKEVAQKLEAIVILDGDNYIGYICLGVVLGLQGKLKEGLQEMDKAILLDPKECDAYFWKGMLSAYHYRGQPSIEKTRQAIEQALAVRLPPILLTPLYWLEKDVPDVFNQYARPLLQKYDV